MLKYILKRVVLVFFTCFIILSLTFILMKMIPVPPAVGSSAAVLAFYNKQVNLGYMYVVDNVPGAVADVIVKDGKAIGVKIADHEFILEDKQSLNYSTFNEEFCGYKYRNYADYKLVKFIEEDN